MVDTNKFTIPRGYHKLENVDPAVNQIRLENLNLTINSYAVLRDFSLTLNEPGITVIVGKNGCGKTTLLDLIAGYKQFNSGKLCIHCSKLKSATHKVAYLPQNYRHTLFPWKSNYNNLIMPIKFAGCNNIHTAFTINQILEKFQIKLPLNKYPYQISGGEQQLLCLLRIYIQEAAIYLFDEPFSALDYSIKDKILRIIKDIKTRENVSLIIVTHDLNHVIDIADQIILFSGTPLKVSQYFQFKNNMPMLNLDSNYRRIIYDFIMSELVK